MYMYMYMYMLNISMQNTIVTVSFCGKTCIVQSTSTLCERNALYESCTWDGSKQKKSTVLLLHVHVHVHVHTHVQDILYTCTGCMPVHGIYMYMF